MTLGQTDLPSFAEVLAGSWELEGSDGKTRLTVVQSGFDPANPPYPGWTGWIAGVPEGMFSID